MSEIRRPGRPRSEVARGKIHETVLRLVDEAGYGALTMEGIAAAAGVGKQTLYRWWPSRAALVMETLRTVAAAQIPVPDTGALESDLLRFLAATFKVAQHSPAVPRMLRGLMAEAQLDPTFLPALRSELLDVRRAALRTILERARERDELLPRCDLELAIDAAFGVLWYRLLVEHASLGPAAAHRLAQMIARAVRR